LKLEPQTEVSYHSGKVRPGILGMVLNRKERSKAMKRIAREQARVYVFDRFRTRLPKMATSRKPSTSEKIIPVVSVTEYFEPFTLLGIDYTYYRLLLEKDGKSTLEFSCP